MLATIVYVNEKIVAIGFAYPVTNLSKLCVN